MSSPLSGQMVLVTCDYCAGSGYEENERKCLICGGYGECWVDESEAVPERRVK